MNNLTEENYAHERLILENHYLFEYQSKSNIEIANEIIAGKLLTNLYKTIGLRSSTKENEYFFELVLEIDVKDKYRFTEAYLSKLAENEDYEQISEQHINMEKDVVFKNQVIKEIWQTQYGEWALQLANDIIIEVRRNNGTNVFISKN